MVNFIYVNRLNPTKEQFNEQIIDSAFETIVKSKTENNQPHFLFIGYGDHLMDLSRETRLKSLIIRKMKEYNIQIGMITYLLMMRIRLITKEKMENYCNGKMIEKTSVNDDLDSFCEDLRLGKKPDGSVQTYFLPKITEEEKKLIERKDSKYLEKFFWQVDVDKAEMKMSKSDSKFVDGLGLRKTSVI